MLISPNSIYMAIDYTFIKCKFNLSLIIMTSIMKDDLTFSSPTQADRISHIFPQSPAEGKEEESNHKMTNLGLRKACLPLPCGSSSIYLAHESNRSL